MPSEASDGIFLHQHNIVLFLRVGGFDCQRNKEIGLPIKPVAKKYGGHLELTDSRRFGHGLLIRALLDKETLK
ncbi:protein BasS [Neisseria meningitidis]|nr:protein BasS [Neisseria meningitidis]